MPIKSILSLPYAQTDQDGARTGLQAPCPVLPRFRRRTKHNVDIICLIPSCPFVGLPWPLGRERWKIYKVRQSPSIRAAATHGPSARRKAATEALAAMGIVEPAPCPPRSLFDERPKPAPGERSEPAIRPDGQRACAICGAPAHFGFGVSIRGAREGLWACMRHRQAVERTTGSQPEAIAMLAEA